jgi:hypothetical protein
MVEFCLRNSYFTWNGKLYRQTNGAAMGSPLSPVVANLFMEDFERKALQSFRKKPKLFVRYVDDTFVIWPHGTDELHKFLHHLNAQNAAITFTMETETDNRLPFLDVLVEKKENGSLGHSVFRKKTHTDLYLHANSHHHPQQKSGIIKTLFHRACSLSDAASIGKEKRHLVETFQRNGFRQENILKIFHNMERKQQGSAPTRTDEENPTTKARAHAILPYVAGTTEKIARALQKHNIMTRFKCVTKMANILVNTKNHYPKDICGGVYQIECSCGDSYIGQTSRALKCRVQEHIRAVKNRQFKQSAVAEHQWSGPAHNIDFDNASLLIKEGRYYPRIIREAIEIAKTPKNFNREDGYTLASAWKRVFKDPIQSRHTSTK